MVLEKNTKNHKTNHNIKYILNHTRWCECSDDCSNLQKFQNNCF